MSLINDSLIESKNKKIIAITDLFEGTNTSIDYAHILKFGDLKILKTRIIDAKEKNNDWEIIFTLPEDLRPTYDLNMSAAPNSADVGACHFNMTNKGIVKVRFVVPGNSYYVWAVYF